MPQLAAMPANPAGSGCGTGRRELATDPDAERDDLVVAAVEQAPVVNALGPRPSDEQVPITERARRRRRPGDREDLLGGFCSPQRATLRIPAEGPCVRESTRIVDEVECPACRLLNCDHEAHAIRAAAREWRVRVLD